MRRWASRSDGKAKRVVPKLRKSSRAGIQHSKGGLKKRGLKKGSELTIDTRSRDDAEWDRQIDEDFAEGGRLRPLLDEVRADLHAGRVEELP
jgi:hypothetical protein